MRKMSIESFVAKIILKKLLQYAISACILIELPNTSHDNNDNKDIAECLKMIGYHCVCNLSFRARACHLLLEPLEILQYLIFMTQ